jgi:2-methylcitrate dehydratase PrpD
MMTTAVGDLVDWSLALTWSTLPPAVQLQARLLVADFAACAAGGATVEGGRLYAAVMREMGGREEATSLVDGVRLPAPAAAFANAFLGNVLDLDDNLLYHSHIGATVVAAALAAGEAYRRSYGEVLAAVVAGHEVAARLMLSMPGVATASEVLGGGFEVRWPPAFGHSANTLGAAVAASRLAGLEDREPVLDAIGIAAYAAPVPTLTRFSLLTRMPLARYAAYGWMAWTGLVAARLAASGMEADRGVLFGEHGFWEMSGARGFSPEVLSQGLGERWWLTETSFKREPACTWSRPAVAALQELAAREELDPDRIDGIEVSTWRLGASPMFMERSPRNYRETQLSIPFAVAAAATGIPPQDWYGEAILKDVRVRRLCGLVQVVPDRVAERSVLEQVAAAGGLGRVRRLPTTVRVSAGGRVLVASAEYGHGDPVPGYRFGKPELTDKVIAHGRLALGPRRAERAAEALLEGAPETDASDIARLCAAHPEES